MHGKCGHVLNSLGLHGFNNPNPSQYIHGYRLPLNIIFKQPSLTLKKCRAIFQFISSLMAQGVLKLVKISQVANFLWRLNLLFLSLHDSSRHFCIKGFFVIFF